jgi:arsenate reductase (glutaredoxin)
MKPQMKLYAIPNCNTVKKARDFLAEHEMNYEFHDFKKQALTEELVAGWLHQVGWQKLLKKTGPTWAQLPDEIKAGIRDDATALPLLVEKPNLIKRPVLVQNGQILALGFSETDYEKLKP